MRVILSNEGKLKKSGRPSVEILTSGDTNKYKMMVDRLEIKNTKNIESYDLG